MPNADTAVIEANFVEVEDKKSENTAKTKEQPQTQTNQNPQYLRAIYEEIKTEGDKLWASLHQKSADEHVAGVRQKLGAIKQEIIETKPWGQELFSKQTKKDVAVTAAATVVTFFVLTPPVALLPLAYGGNKIVTRLKNVGKSPEEIEAAKQKGSWGSELFSKKTVVDAVKTGIEIAALSIPFGPAVAFGAPLIWNGRNVATRMMNAGKPAPEAAQPTSWGKELTSAATKKEAKIAALGAAALVLTHFGLAAAILVPTAYVLNGVKQRVKASRPKKKAAPKADAAPTPTK